jgi:hypothetical protein
MYEIIYGLFKFVAYAVSVVFVVLFFGGFIYLIYSICGKNIFYTLGILSFMYITGWFIIETVRRMEKEFRKEEQKRRANLPPCSQCGKKTDTIHKLIKVLSSFQEPIPVNRERKIKDEHNALVRTEYYTETVYRTTERRLYEEICSSCAHKKREYENVFTLPVW